MQVVVLAGGKGTRLRPWTLTRPKPGLMLLDRPLLAHVLDLLPTDAVTSVLVAAGYLVDGLRSILDEHQLPWPVKVIEEDVPLGTGGALRNMLDHLEDRFICLNGDVLCGFDGQQMIEAGKGHPDAEVILAVREVEDTQRFGIIEFMPDGVTVAAFKEKPEPHETTSRWASAGCYMLARTAIKLLPTGASSLERDLFPRLAGEKQAFGVQVEGEFVDAGTPDSWMEAVALAIARCGDSGSTLEDIWVHPEAVVDAEARISRCAIGAGAHVAHGAVLIDCDIQAGASIENGCHLERCLIGPDVIIEEGTHLDGAVLA